MKQTERFQLNQWELTDRIRMEEFNADNAKLEAALTALDTRVPRCGELIRSYSPGLTIPHIELAGIDWNEWEIAYTVFPFWDDIGKFYVVSIPQGEVVNTQEKNPNALIALDSKPFTLIFFPRHNANNPFNAFYIGSPCGFAYTTTTFAQTRFLEVSPSGTANSIRNPPCLGAAGISIKMSPP